MVAVATVAVGVGVGVANPTLEANPLNQGQQLQSRVQDTLMGPPVAFARSIILTGNQPGGA